MADHDKIEDPASPTALNPAYEISTDPARLNVVAIHSYLTRSYWAQGIDLSLVRRSLQGSLNFGVYQTGPQRLEAQVGLARVITDRATFAYLCDVYILEPHRSQGLSKRLMQQVVAHPDLQGLRRFLLATADAHRLYQQFGFATVTDAANFMQIVKRDLYLGQPG